MRLVEYNSIPSWAADTKTMKTVGALLGDKPHKLSQVVRMRPELTANMLTDGLMNVYYKDTKSKQFEAIPSFKFEWTVNTDRITRIRFAEDCTDDGQGQRDVKIILAQKYYDKNDTFRLDNGQLLFVRFVPKKLAENRWEYTVKLVGDNPERKIDTRYMTKGRETLYMSNYFPELSERGYSKFTLNAEKHVNYISRHRHSDSMSSDFAALKEVYFQTGSGQNSEFFKMSSMDKRLTEQFLLTRNNNLLFGQSNYDINGKCLLKEEDGRDIPMGDGIITQFARYCDKFGYHRLSISDLDDILISVMDKTNRTTGNQVTMVCNRVLWRQVQKILREEAKGYAPLEGSYYINKTGNGIKVGANFKGYEFAGNTIMFAVDESLTNFYPNQGYGICMDTGLVDGTPNISLMTLKGREMISGTIAGLGGLSGTSNGPIATSVDGSEYHLQGYSGVAVLNPYAGIILKENVVF